jgi:sortase A
MVVKLLRILGCVLLLLGAALSGRAAYLHGKAELAGILIRRAWETRIDSGASRPPWSWADTHPVARLRIRRLHYDEIVLEGATPRTLAFGPARVFTGAELGEPGNLILAGHRTSWFRSLERIKLNDGVTVQWFDPRDEALLEREYSVASIQIVSPDEARSFLMPTTEDSLTLITCFPFSASPTSPQRFIVRAVPAGSSHLTDVAGQDEKTPAAVYRDYRQTAFGK